ncbi:MAG: glutathione S-transferase family protein [Rhodospirillales bacterium]
MSDLVFYTNPMSRGRLVRWLLEEIGQPYRTEIVAYGAPMKSPEYLAINPMGKVPALVHGTSLVTECPAICAYMAETFPEAGLAPTAEERAAYYRWLFFAAGPVEAALFNHTLGVEVPDELRGRSGYGSYKAVLDVLQQAVAANPYLAGQRFTAVDIYVGTMIGWGMRFEAMEERPGFADYVARISAREAYVRANALDDAALEQPEDSTAT